MTDLENLVAQVWSADTRPLVEESWRCYNAGAIRASITATWTAITADIINKLVQLADDGDAGAIAFRESVASAQKQGISVDGVRAMQTIESSLLARAAEFELIDSIGQRELERIREDRNICAHPSLRSFNEVYEPRAEVARGHLAVALSTLLVHPPTQGAKVLDSFLGYTCDPSFVPAVAHIQATFFDRVRTVARANIAKLAAKHALRELDPGGRLSAIEYADRCAIVLSAYAQRDRELVRATVAAQREHFQGLEGGMQLRALVRLGDEDFFWSLVDQTLSGRLQALIQKLENSPALLVPWVPLSSDAASILAMVRSAFARERLPALAEIYSKLSQFHRMSVVSIRPDPYFVTIVIEFLAAASSYRVGEQSGQLLVQHAQFLTVSDVEDALDKWASNNQCREAAQMPELAVALYRNTGHLGPARGKAFVDFLAAVQALADEGDSYYRYPALEEALRSAGLSNSSESTTAGEDGRS
ncbi:hypothetical protein ABZ345_39845 [Lentzea sp. NPDC005914]|uniref:hypothetical protein n=1 Tax=Lentzea sp. NPDC005914 TaxID=3154572 RepID=UPI0033D1894D